MPSSPPAGDHGQGPGRQGPAGGPGPGPGIDITIDATVDITVDADALDDLTVCVAGLAPSRHRVGYPTDDTWPLALTVPASTVAGDVVCVRDPEGAPLLHVTVAGVASTDGGSTKAWGDVVGASGAARHPLTVRDASASPRLLVLADRPLITADVDSLAGWHGELVIVGLVGSNRVTDAQALERTLRVAGRELGADLHLLPVGWHGTDAADFALLASRLHASALYLATARSTPFATGRVGGAEVVNSEQGAAAWSELACGGGPATSVLDGSYSDVLRTLGHRQQGLVVLFTGLSGSGKSTLAKALTREISHTTGRFVTVLDGDIVRRELTAGLGFSPEDRAANVRRVGWVAAEIAKHDGVVVCSLIAPYEASRTEMRDLVQASGARFVLVHVSTPLRACEARDRKGLYARARSGEIKQFTGISAPYEEPENADVVVDTSVTPLDECIEMLSRRIAQGRP